MADSAASSTPGPIPRAIAWALARKPVRAFLLYAEHRGPALADGVTYRTLFSVFAGVLLGFSIATIWLAGNPVAFQALIDAVDAAIPGLGAIIDPSVIPAPAGLSIATVVSFIALIGAAIGAIGSLRVALRNLADQVTDDVFWVWVLLRDLALAVLLGGLLVAAAGATYLGAAFVGTVNAWIGVPADSAVATWGIRAVSIGVVFALDAVVIALMFRLLAGVRASPRTPWTGALLGAAGLIVLQQLSALFVGGATSNPLLASFASLIALLLWLNLSAQVILIAAAYIITGVEDDADRVRSRFGAATFAQRRVHRAEIAVTVATRELDQARDARAKERAG